MVAQFVSFFLALAILRETSMEMDVMKTFNVTMNFAVKLLILLLLLLLLLLLFIYSFLYIYIHLFIASLSEKKSLGQYFSQSKQTNYYIL